MKFLLAEIIISAIYTACMPQLWGGGFFGYILYVIVVLILPLLFGYIFAAFFLLLGYIIKKLFPVKLPSIHKVAFIGFLILFIGIAIQDIKKIYFQKDVKDVQNTIEETTQKDNTSTNEKAILSNDKEEMHQYMRGVLDTIVKNMDKEFASHADQVHIPKPFLDDIIYLVRSKEKLNTAINKQDVEIKQYKEDLKNMFDDIMDNNVKFAMSKCTKKYKRDLCEATMKPFKSTLVKIQDKNYEVLQQVIDCLEEELSVMRFIDMHYDKFRVTDKGPYFTDPGLQKYFTTKMQNYAEKMLALSGEIDKIKQNSKTIVGKN